MFKRRGVMLVLLSLVLGSFAAYAANSWLNNRLAIDSGPDTNTASVVAAALPIPYGVKLESRHLKYISLPEDSVPSNAFRDLEEIEGQVSKTPVEAGAVLLASNFAAHSQGSTLAALVAENMRAVTVRVNDVVGVAGFLLPGNRVDVISVRGGGNGRERAVSDTILHNIKVLAVDQTTATEQNDPVIVRAVTLELSPGQSLELVKAKAEGSIQLTLRNPLDETVAVKPPPPPKAKPKPRPRVARAPTRSTIQVIRGTQVAKEKAKL